MNAQESMDLQAALRKLESWQSQPPAAGQRRFERFAARGEARLWPGEAGLTTQSVPTVHIRDVSRGGVGVLSNQAASSGQFWQVQLGTEKLAITTLPGFCRFCREVVPGAYLIGIAFGHVLYHRGIHRLGPVVASGVLLVTPFLTYLGSAIFLKESMTAMQLAGGASGVVGGALRVRARAEADVTRDA